MDYRTLARLKSAADTVEVLVASLGSLSKAIERAEEEIRQLQARLSAVESRRLTTKHGNRQ